MPLGDLGLLILALLGDFLLIWAVLATIGVVWMFWKMPDLVYGIIDQLLSERGFPRTRGSSSKGRPTEGIGGQIVGAIVDKFTQPPQEGGTPSLPSAPYRPGR